MANTVNWMNATPDGFDVRDAGNGVMTLVHGGGGSTVAIEGTREGLRDMLRATLAKLDERNSQ